MSDAMVTIETELAKAIVQTMVGGLTELVKKVPALFRRRGRAGEQAAGAELERSTAALEAAAEPDLEREVIRQEATWETLLRGLLAEHDDVRAAMEGLLTELRDGRSAATDPGPGPQVVSGGGHDAVQQVQAGRDAFAAGRDQNFGFGPGRRP
ncbi:hypothetical protein ACFOVU_13635 [Nocardiopsis sediminis]|uniref:Uncharacterized protein n=1 Tax=Nocardiopsis sediminis TaxID=1778267 RepID=A0ABV8FLH2_9ACTN